MCARFQFASCTLAKRWCIHQSVNVYLSCLKQYLICGWLYCSQHDDFQKHRFELKLFLSVFLRVITKSNLIKQVWSCKPMRHCKYSGNPWIQSKLGETYIKISNYENNVLLYSYILLYTFLHGGRKTNFTLMSLLRVFTETITLKKKVFIKITWQILPSLRNPLRSVNIPFSGAIVKIWTFLFVTSC